MRRRIVVSVIIPVYNQLPFLLKCVQSLTATVNPQEVEIILVDDSSPDFKLPELMGFPFKVMRSESNRGFAATCNAGALQASGRLLFFLNSDTIATPNWLEPMVRAFDDAAIGIAGPKLLFPAEPEYGPAAGGIQSCGGLFDAGKGPYHRFIGMEAGYHLANKPGVVSWITGAAQMVRADLFRKLGGYDEGYKRGYFEDVDLCCRAKADANVDTWYEPRSVFVHHVGRSTASKAEAQTREAAKQFRANSYRFHGRWDAKITPDSQNVFVNY